MSATSFTVGVGFSLLSDLEGFLVTVSAIGAVVAPATMRGRVGGGRERGR